MVLLIHSLPTLDELADANDHVPANHLHENVPMDYDDHAPARVSKNLRVPDKDRLI